MIIQQIKTTVAGIALAIAIVISAFVAWGITSNHYKHKIEGIQKQHAEKVAEYEQKIGAIKAKAQEQTDAAMNRMKAAQDQLAKLDQQKSQELANAKTENDLLRRDVADGARRVRILNANLVSGCNSSAGTTGGNSSTGSVGDGTTVEVTRAFGSDVLDLREGIIADQSKLTYLQSYVRDVVKQCKVE